MRRIDSAAGKRYLPRLKTPKMPKIRRCICGPGPRYALKGRGAPGDEAPRGSGNAFPLQLIACEFRRQTRMYSRATEPSRRAITPYIQPIITQRIAYM